MTSGVDILGSLKHLGVRINPFSNYAWAHHRSSGLSFRFHRRDVVGRTILRHQDYEPQLTAWLRGVLDAQPPDALFIDVGANLGWFSLNAARHEKVGRVIALEPDVGNHALLQDNIAKNGLGNKIDALTCAAGAGAGLARLYRYKASNLGRHSLVANHGLGGSWVAVESLDTLLERLQLRDAPIAAIKIDVEGYEPAVLSGAGAALQRTNALIIELSPDLSSDTLDLSAMLVKIETAGLVPQAWDQPGPVPDYGALRNCTAQCTVAFRRPG